MSCKKIICIGSLDTAITLKKRSITAPIQNSVDYTQTFTEDTVVWAKIKTSGRGEIIFDRTNTARIVTHLFYIRFLTGITAQTWIELESINYDILSTTDLEEKHEWLLLKATKRGIKTLPINQI